MLHLAAAEGNVKVARLLLEEGADASVGAWTMHTFCFRDRGCDLALTFVQSTAGTSHHCMMLFKMTINKSHTCCLLTVVSSMRAYHTLSRTTRICPLSDVIKFSTR